MDTPPDSSPAGRGRRLQHAGLFALVVLAQFTVFETALRVWGSSEAAPAFQGLFEGDARVGYRLRPNARTRYTTSEFDTEIAINNVGVRDDEDLGPKLPHEKRIVVLGDSLVLAVQVSQQETFVELLEERLNAPGDGTVYRVLNAGVQGYGPVQQALLLDDLGPALQPDLVLVTIYVGNDAEEAAQSAHLLRGAEPSPIQGARQTLRTQLRRVVRRSMVLQVVRLRVVAVLERTGYSLTPPDAPLQSYAADPAPRIAEGLSAAREAIERIVSTGARLGARTAIVLMPARFQLDDEDFGRLELIVAEAGGALVRDAATHRFHEALGPVPVPRLDLLPALRAALPGPDLYFQANAHLTPRGHRVVADALDGFIAGHGLLQTPDTR